MKIKSNFIFAEWKMLRVRLALRAVTLHCHWLSCRLVEESSVNLMYRIYSREQATNLG